MKLLTLVFIFLSTHPAIAETPSSPAKITAKDCTLLWESAATKVTEKTQIKEVWKTLKACPSSSPRQTFMVLARFAATAKKANEQDTIRMFSADTPESIYTVADQLPWEITQYMSALGTVKPLPLPVLVKLAFAGERWFLRAEKEDPADQIMVLGEVVRIMTETGRMSRVLPLVELGLKRRLPFDPDMKSHLMSSYCWASRDIGRPEKCTSIISAFYGKESNPNITVEKAQTALALGEHANALQMLNDLAKTPGGMPNAPWTYLHLAVAQFNNDQLDAAEANVGKFLAARESKGTTASAYGKLVGYAIKREKKQFSTIWKDLDGESKFLAETVAPDSYLAANWDYSLIMIAMATQDRTRLATYLRSLKGKLHEDTTHDFFRKAIDVIEKKLANQPTDAALVLLKKTRGEKTHIFLDFNKNFNRL